MDELEFEVTPTDTGVQRSVRAPRRLPPGRRPPRGVTVALIGACVVVVTIALALASVPNLSGRMNTLLHGTPTATPRILSGGNLLYVENAVLWGQLSLNGTPVALDGLTSNGVTGALFLKRGVNSIVFRADPFPEVRCRISAPVSTSDTCPLAVYTGPDHAVAPAARALDLTPRLDALSTAARADLLRAVSAYLTVQSAPTVVQPGDTYVNAARQVVVAQQAMQATFTQTLATSAPGDFCAPLCTRLPNPNLPIASVADFVLNAHLTGGFAYSTSAGGPLLTNAPISANAEISNDETVSLLMTWNGGWRVALDAAGAQTNSPACIAAEQALTPYIVDPNSNSEFIYIDASIAAPNPADGCVLRLGAGGYGGPTTASDYLHIFYRFGVVFAVEDLSRWYLLNKLPQTNATEAALAWQIDATQPYS